ncbi:MAG TPA: hypothetical protein VHK69_05635 [Chitinophagaceae bacterium]|nr:hypothetical protein [Chitinophagaceae bacterium]
MAGSFFVAAGFFQSATAQNPPAESKVFAGKVKFLTTENFFNNLKAHEDYVGLILFFNISKKPLTVAGITKEYDNVEVSLRAQKIPPGGKGIITFTIRNPEPGAFKNSSLIFFREFNEPVAITLKGHFLERAATSAASGR